MAEVTFQARKYALAHADIAQKIGADQDEALSDHYSRIGRREHRGIALTGYVLVEKAVGSDQGDLFITGWADRRIFPIHVIEAEVGYVRHAIDLSHITWYRRPDVSEVMGDTQQDSGFMLLTRVEGLHLHTDFTLFINGRKLFQQPAMHWKSLPTFLSEALSQTALFADRPIGTTLRKAETIGNQIRALWSRYLSSLAFLPAMRHDSGRKPRFSIVITLYRDFGMLLQQLGELAPYLELTGGEVVIVGNALAEPELLLSRLHGFCQIHRASLRVYLCTDNSGFAAANNFGAAEARGETVIFMNPDVFPAGDHTAIADFLTSDCAHTLTGARLYYGDGGLMHAGMYAVRDMAVDPAHGTVLPALRVEHFGKGLCETIADAERAAFPGAVDRQILVTAALWKIDRNSFIKAGGLSTDYLYAYYEDADFCLRLLENGGTIGLDGKSQWIHFENGGRNLTAPLRAALWLNRCLFSARFADCPLVYPAEAEADLL